MTSQKALNGIELISCAKASASAGVEAAAKNCGYGADIETFRAALQQACADMGVEVDGIADLVTDQQQVALDGGLEIAPDTASDL
ncbi:MAG: hypothetical protein AAF959_07345 [Cyanobacteria bacterium P01_D01_bin.56]